MNPSRPEGEGLAYTYRLARPGDVQPIVDLHYSCFTEDTNTLTHFGREFVEQAYKWLISSPLCFTMVAEHEDEVIAFESACDRPYYAPMILQNWRTVLKTLLKRPRVLLHKSVRNRLLFFPGKLLRRLRRGSPPDFFMGVRPACLVLMGVHPDHRAGFELASQLLVRVCDEGRARGWQEVYGGIYKENLPAIFLYKIHGFRTIPELETEYWTFVVRDL